MKYEVQENGSAFAVVVTLRSRIIGVVDMRPSRVDAEDLARDLNTMARLFDHAPPRRLAA